MLTVKEYPWIVGTWTLVNIYKAKPHSIIMKEMWSSTIP